MWSLARRNLKILIYFILQEKTKKDENSQSDILDKILKGLILVFPKITKYNNLKTKAFRYNLNLQNFWESRHKVLIYQAIKSLSLEIRINNKL